jgi:hypothetical protein
VHPFASVHALVHVPAHRGRPTSLPRRGDRADSLRRGGGRCTWTSTASARSSCCCRCSPSSSRRAHRWLAAHRQGGGAQPRARHRAGRPAAPAGGQEPPHGRERCRRRTARPRCCCPRGRPATPAGGRGLVGRALGRDAAPGRPSLRRCHAHLTQINTTPRMDLSTGVSYTVVATGWRPAHERCAERRVVLGAPQLKSSAHPAERSTSCMMQQFTPKAVAERLPPASEYSFGRAEQD